MKILIETLWGLQYKLCMMGVPILGLLLIYGNNMSVIHNTQRLDSTLKNKSNSICYHTIRESLTMKESLTGHVPSVENPVDIFITVVPSVENRKHLIDKVLHDLYKQ